MKFFNGQNFLIKKINYNHRARYNAPGNLPRLRGYLLHLLWRAVLYPNTPVKVDPTKLELTTSVRGS